MKIDKAHIIVMDCLSDMRSPIELLLSENREGVFNRDFMGLLKHDLCLALQQLVSLGLVSEMREGDNEPVKDLLELTEDGGRAWEFYFRPQWDKLLVDEYEFCSDEVERCEITTMDIFIINEIVGNLKAVGVFNYEMEMVSSWQPFYWKVLGPAYRIEYCKDLLSGGSHDVVADFAVKWKLDTHEVLSSLQGQAGLKGIC